MKTLSVQIFHSFKKKITYSNSFLSANYCLLEVGTTDAGATLKIVTLHMQALRLRNVNTTVYCSPTDQNETSLLLY